jgi:hypoxanthine phosphoribosyltransferase
MPYSADLKILIGREALAAAVKRIGQELSASYRSRNPVLVGVLKGSVIFISDLIRQLDFPLELDFVSLSSYGSGIQSSGKVKMLLAPSISLAGRHVLVVEDIVDTGLSMKYLVKRLARQSPASLKICALLDKPSRREAEVKIDYLGFNIQDRFIVGYGLDFAQQYRNLPDICYIEKDA